VEHLRHGSCQPGRTELQRYTPEGRYTRASAGSASSVPRPRYRL
ncbi:MAG: hypothetical protein AVDCRST_MAG37-1131, partial [uncultured Rubrobacteraceae bacterium]